MADRSSQLMLAALTRAAADAAGVPLHGSKAAPGLFPSTALGKQAAQRCCDEGLLRPVPADRPAAPSGRNGHAPLCTITDKGISWLLAQVSPRQVLEDFVRVLEAREAQVGQLVATARHMQAGLEALRTTLAPVLEQAARPGGELKALFHDFHNDAPPPCPAGLDNELLAALGRWPAGGAEDCPLPELFGQVQPGFPELSIGAFHDALRRLLDAGRIYLHPWTGPLYAIPQPPYALLVGHEVAYYASPRCSQESGIRSQESAKTDTSPRPLTPVP